MVMDAREFDGLCLSVYFWMECVCVMCVVVIYERAGGDDGARLVCVWKACVAGVVIVVEVPAR